MSFKRALRLERGSAKIQYCIMANLAMLGILVISTTVVRGTHLVVARVEVGLHGGSKGTHCQIQDNCLKDTNRGKNDGTKKAY